MLRRLTHRRRVLWATLALLLALAHGAAAQRLLVTTTARAATKEAARLYVQSLDMKGDGFVSAPLPLPGVEAASPLLLLPGTSTAVLTSGPPWQGGDLAPRHTWTYTSTFDAISLGHMKSLPASDAWRESAACTLPGADALIILGVRYGLGRGWLGRVAAHDVSSTGEVASEAQLAWEWPSIPLAASPVGDSGRIAVLSRDPASRRAILDVFDIETGAHPVEALPIVDETAEYASGPSGLAVTEDGALLLIMTSGYALDRHSGEASSWIHALDTTGFTEKLSPLALQGTARTDEAPLRPTAQGACWAATRSPSLGFAYATKVHVDAEGLQKVDIHSFTATTHPVIMAPSPDGQGAAFASENRLKVLAGPGGEASVTEFEGSIGCVRWTGEGLFVGEGGRLHQLAPASGEALKTVQLQSGWVTDVALLPEQALPQPDTDADGLVTAAEEALGTSPDDPDTDGDGIPDGADPEPLVPSPQLALPSEVVFHEESAGTELKALFLSPPHAADASWSIDFDRLRMPWLRIHPFSGGAGSLPTAIYLGVDAAAYSREGSETGSLTVYLTGTQPDKKAFGSPAEVNVRILPAVQRGMRRILWVWGTGHLAGPPFRSEEDPRHLAALGDVVAGPPHFFVHHEVEGPFVESLESYAVVVLQAEAIAQGAVTRQAVLEYVAHGGGLLVLGAYLGEDEGRSLLQWLAPARIQIDTTEKIDGRFDAQTPDWVCRHWDSFPIASGCAIRTGDEDAVLVPASSPSDAAVFVTRTYGRGRIAVLAAPTPLESARLGTAANRRFAEDLFRWLGRSSLSSRDQDCDGDGLRDDLEDVNNNGKTDTGETNYLNPDSDGDGVPDGLEDANLNGLLDPGETNPLNTDSDGDGLLDGADTSPLPSIDAPTPTRASPAHGPAEGGTMVHLFGRNFPPASSVWFGDRQSPRARTLGPSDVVAEAPPHPDDEGGEVALRVVDDASRQEGTLPSGFRYTPRTSARLVLQTLSMAEKQYGIYQGSTLLRLECSPEVPIEQLILILSAGPKKGFRWKNLVCRVPDRGTRDGPMARPTRSGDFAVVLSRAAGHGPLAGELGIVNWEADIRENRARRWEIAVTQARVVVRNGQILDASVRPCRVEPDAPRWGLGPSRE